MNAPLVSVIVPVYNREKYLQKCIESITGQTLRNIEIICVDDGSTDSSLSKLEALQAADERIKIISRENRGVSASRNEGIEAARGDYVAFMDSDDFYPDLDILETLYTKAKTHGVKICGGEMLFYDENNGGLRQDNSSETEGYRFSREGVIQYRDYQFDWGFWRFIYDRSMLIENNLIFPPFKRGEDAVFFAKAHIISKEFYACRKAVYAYRINHKTSEWPEEVVHDIVSGLRELWDIAVQHDLKKLQQYCCRPTLFKKQILTQEELNFLDSMEYVARVKPKSVFTWVYSKYRSNMVEDRRHLCILGRKYSYYKTNH